MFALALAPRSIASAVVAVLSCAGTNQTFKHSPVYCGRIHSLRKVIKRAERTYCASPDNGFHTCMPDSLNRSQSIPDGAPRRRETCFAFIDVRWQQLNTLCPKFL